MTKPIAEKEPASDRKLAIMEGVREYGEGRNVELWRNSLDRLVIRSFNQKRNTYTDVDAVDLLTWLTLKIPKRNSCESEQDSGCGAASLLEGLDRSNSSLPGPR
jgi:hypothetical protein